MKCNNILEAIGQTPIIRLNRLAKDLPAEVWVKADYMNPGGSVKDRIGLAMIDEAERTGKLKPGGTIIEGTSGNTGMGLALVACVRGYKVVFTITDKQSREKIDLLKAFGAEVIVCPTAVEPEDPRSYYSVAAKLAREIPNSFYPNQYENPMNPDAHYRTTGPEIWKDTEGKITHFVCGVGTGGTISGVGRYLKEQNPDVKIIGVDPIGSLYYEKVKTGKTGKALTYVVEGIGEDFFPGTMNLKILDDILQVSDEECFVWARRLAKQEAIFTGGSGGGCISAALKIARNAQSGDMIVAFMPDSGSRYMSKVFNDGWMREHGYVDAEVALSAADVIRVKRQNRQNPRHDRRRPLPNRLPRPANHAAAGHFAAPHLRRRKIHRHSLRRPNPESSPARKRSPQTSDPRSDGRPAAASPLRPPPSNASPTSSATIAPPSSWKCPAPN